MEVGRRRGLIVFIRRGVDSRCLFGIKNSSVLDFCVTLTLKTARLRQAATTQQQHLVLMSLDRAIKFLINFFSHSFTHKKKEDQL